MVTLQVWLLPTFCVIHENNIWLTALQNQTTMYCEAQKFAYCTNILQKVTCSGSYSSQVQTYTPFNPLWNSSKYNDNESLISGFMYLYWKAIPTKISFILTNVQSNCYINSTKCLAVSRICKIKLCTQKVIKILSLIKRLINVLKLWKGGNEHMKHYEPWYSLSFN
jgi:hypothetical protein